MSNPTLDTVALRGLLPRLQANDPAARDELLRACERRLEALTRKLLRGFPNVKRWEDTGDVYQNAAPKLLRALEKLPVADTRAFFALAARIIRNQLIDRARHYYGPNGLGANHDSRDPAHAAAPDPAALDRLTALHEAIERLPADQREVVDLVYYHEWPQDRIAELLGVSTRTVRRLWSKALGRLGELLGDRPPIR